MLPERGRAVFNCYSTSGRLSYTHWEVNGFRYDNDIIDIPGFQRPDFDTRSEIGTLIINNLTSQLNETRLRCYTTQSAKIVTSIEAVIILQGMREINN